MLFAMSARCWQCGYDLGGIPRQGRCPECGSWITDTPRRRWWDHALPYITMCGPFLLLLILVPILAFMFDNGKGRYAGPLAIATLLAAGTGPLVGAIIVLSPRTRWPRHPWPRWSVLVALAANALVLGSILFLLLSGR